MTELHELRAAEDASSHAHDYDDFHAARFRYVLEIAARITPTPHRVLDVGVSSLSGRLAQAFGEVWTLGFPETGVGERHIDFDLNSIAAGGAIASAERFDLIVFCEVIEHLHIPAEAALIALERVLAPGGSLILQTPNAAEVMKRVALLMGHQPYEKLRLNPANPGHFREYTMAELAEAAAAAGLFVREASYADYFKRTPPVGFHPMRSVLDGLRRVVPSFRDGQTLVLGKAGEPAQ